MVSSAVVRGVVVLVWVLVVVSSAVVVLIGVPVVVGTLVLVVCNSSVVLRGGLTVVVVQSKSVGCGDCVVDDNVVGPSVVVNVVVKGKVVSVVAARSEERREGKECRSRWWPYH